MYNNNFWLNRRHLFGPGGYTSNGFTDPNRWRFEGDTAYWKDDDGTEIPYVRSHNWTSEDMSNAGYDI